MNAGAQRTISLYCGGNPEAERAARIFARCLAERGPVGALLDQPGGYPLRLISNANIEGEGYAIADAGAGLAVQAGCGLGLLYGLGRLLRDGQIGANGFTPGAWRGLDQPALLARGIYFATHFHNWYHVAPVEEIQRYVEELALWGTNTVCVWFDLHHFYGIDDPAARNMLARLNAVLGSARRLGMKTALILLANEAYANSPQDLRADWTAGHDGYTSEPQGHYHVELCPSKTGAIELLLGWAEERLRAFADTGLDYLCLWPYDQGGCTCAACAPWGVNGYLRCAEPLARLYKKLYPAGKVILSTWYFDHFTSGEWSGLARRLEPKPDWIDLLLADDYGDHFPPFLGRNGAPSGLPVVGFPEISMYRCLPWGGYGANPLPQHFQALWEQCAGLVAGGFPYSEGIFEDLNKALMARFYWDPASKAKDTLSEYLRYEYGPEAVEPLLAATAILEHNLPRQVEGKRVAAESLREAGAAWELVRKVDRAMNAERKGLWRWRLFFRRAQIDAELAQNGGALSGDALREAFAEITRISHAQDALETWVRPPVIAEESR